MNEKNKISPGQNLNIEKEKVIPILEEKVRVSKRKRITGSVRISKKVHEREELVDEPFTKEIVSIERIPVNRFVESAVSIREENGITIVPIMEEVIVTEKKLFLKEEIHISKTKKTFREPRKVLVRSEEAVIEHLEPKE